MIAAGVGDLVAKLTSVADWELGHLLWAEPYDAAIAARARAAAWGCVARLEAIGHGDEAGVQALLEGLIESGLCMLDFGETRLASGYEHHISHFLELLLLQQGRHSALHGAKVGLGVLVSAARYDALRQLTRAEVATRLGNLVAPDRERQLAVIRSAYGPHTAPQVIAIQEPFLEMTPDGFAALKDRIRGQWDAIEQVLHSVPPAAQFAAWLTAVGGATRPEPLGLTAAEVAQAAAAAPFYRNRFTVAKLGELLLDSRQKNAQ
jgi:glycerol-1-phosphate dehydrogenase [NAD(P)+]